MAQTDQGIEEYTRLSEAAEKVAEAVKVPLLHPFPFPPPLLISPLSPL